MEIIQYTDDRAEVLAANVGKDLIAEWNHADGSFLVFGNHPQFDLSRDELKALLKLIIDQLNVLRVAAGLSEITYQQAKDVIKTELGL